MLAGPPGTRNTDPCELPYGCWQLNPCPQEEQLVLLSTEPASQNLLLVILRCLGIDFHRRRSSPHPTPSQVISVTVEAILPREGWNCSSTVVKGTGHSAKDFLASSSGRCLFSRDLILLA